MSERKDGVKMVSGDEDHTAVSLSHHDQVNEERRATLETAYSEGMAEAEAETDIESASEDADDVERAFGASDYDVIKTFVGLKNTNPTDAAEALAQWFLKNPTFAEPEKPKELKGAYDQVGVKMPSGEIVWSQPGSIKHDAALAAASIKSPEAKAQQREARALLKQAFPGVSYGEAMKQIKGIHREAQKNPIKAAARLGAAFGAPITEAQAQQQAQAHTAVVEIGQLIATEFKSLDGRQQEVAQAMRDGYVDMSGGWRQTLKSASNALAQIDTIRAEVKAFVTKHKPSPATKKRMQAALNSGQAKNIEQAYNLAQQPAGLNSDIKQAARASR